MPRPSTPRVSQQPQQLAVAAADVEHLGARRDHLGDHQKVDARAARHARRLRHGEIALEPPEHRHRSRRRRQAARLGGAFEETAHDREQLRLVEQEGVVPLVGDDLGERDARAAGIERMHDGARIRGRKQPVRGERDHAEARRRPLEGIGEHAVAVRREIEIVHRAGQIEIGVGIEALDEADALVAQIALHLEIGIERERRIVAVLEPAAELAVQRRVRQIGDVRAHARDREPAPRIGALGEIAPAAPFRIGHHGLAADLVEGDVLRRMPRRAAIGSAENTRSG